VVISGRRRTDYTLSVAGYPGPRHQTVRSGEDFREFPAADSFLDQVKGGTGPGRSIANRIVGCTAGPHDGCLRAGPAESRSSRRTDQSEPDRRAKALMQRILVVRGSGRQPENANLRGPSCPRPDTRCRSRHRHRRWSCGAEHRPDLIPQDIQLQLLDGWIRGDRRIQD